MSEHDNIAAKSLAYRAMAETWELPDALESTSAMRRKGETYLPKEKGESPESYDRRLKRSWLYGAYTQTLGELSGAPFQQAVDVRNDEQLPDRIRAMERNVDLRGRTLTQFGRDVLREAVHRGFSLILPDMAPRRGPSTVGQDERSNVRPFFSHISPKDFYGYTPEESEAGVERVASFRIHEERVVRDPEGRFGERIIHTLRVFNLAYPDSVARRDELRSVFMTEDGSLLDEPLRMLGIPGTIEHYQTEEDDEDDYRLVDVTPYSFVGFPLVPVYTNRKGFLYAEPALRELAEKNAEHWQSASDQRHLLRFARVPIYTRFGASSEEINRGLTLGASLAWDTKKSPQDAAIRVVEHEGKAIGAGRQDLLDLEEQMETLRMRPRMKNTGAPKATVAAIGEARGQSAVETWALDTAHAFRTAYRHALQFETGNPAAELPEDFGIRITASNLALDPRAEAKAGSLLKMREAGDIDRATFLREMKTIGHLSEDVDVNSVLEALGTNEDQESQAFFDRSGVVRQLRVAR